MNFKKTGTSAKGIPGILLSFGVFTLMIFTAKTNHAHLRKFPACSTPGSISGTVRTRSGMVVPLARLSLILEDQIVKTIEADSDGYYAFKDLEAGKYVVKAMSDACKPLASGPIIVDKEHEEEVCDLSLPYLHPIHYRLSYKNDINCADTPLTKQVDSILVLKSKRELLVFRSKELLKVYHVSLGRNPVGPKQFKGDNKTPEGIYHINGKNPNSECHKNLGISYPSDADRAYARSHGQSTGGDVKIHGIINGYDGTKEDYQNWDWTYGCVGVTDDEIDELFAHIAVGNVINIRP